MKLPLISFFFTYLLMLPAYGTIFPENETDDTEVSFVTILKLSTLCLMLLRILLGFLKEL
jgi:hypothetical protein